MLNRLVSEPLLHFLLIGVLVFSADRLTREKVADPNEIAVDAEAHARLAGIFRDIESRMPTPDEMDRLVERYILNETLFREARALGLDHGDEMLRERLIQRMRLLIYSGIEVADPGDEVLRAWLAERPRKYEVPAKLGFRVIGLDAEEAEARAEAKRAAAREAAGEPVKRPGRPMLSFIDRPRVQLVATFDEEFVAAIEAAPTGEWSPVPSARGWQVVKQLNVIPAETPAFEEIRPRVLADWRDAEVQRTARAAVDTLKRDYPVRIEPYDPDSIVAVLPTATGDK